MKLRVSRGSVKASPEAIFMAMVVTLICAALLQAAAPKSDTTPPPVDLRDASARVTFDLGSGPGETVSVHGFELQITNPGPAALSATSTPAAQLAGSAQVKFERAPGTYTADLAAHGASGQRIPAVTVEVLDGAGKPAMVLHLGDVLVTSDHVVVLDRSALEQQKLALLDAVAQSTSDLQEAERQQNLTEALDKKRLSSAIEVARVHSQVDLLRKRLANQRQRLAMLEAHIAATGTLDEQVTLTFARFDLQTPGSGPVSFSFEPVKTRPSSLPR